MRLTWILGEVGVAITVIVVGWKLRSRKWALSRNPDIAVRVSNPVGDSGFGIEFLAECSIAESQSLSVVVKFCAKRGKNANETHR